MKQAWTMPSLQFPPYGIMDNDYLKNLGSKNLPGSPAESIVPPDFGACGEIDAAGREAAWVDLRDRIVHEIEDSIWPVWDAKSRAWKGAAVANMLPLTCADLEILLQLRVGPHLAINSLPTANTRAINCPSHLAFFEEEDQAKIFSSYSFYDRTLDSRFAPTFADAFFAGLGAKCSSTQLQLKQRFQRPRAYQIAFLMAISEFNLEEATSSMTPSMVSGHSLQGLIGVGAVMEQIIKSGVSFTDDNWQALRQFAVDIGDRRVMAGVHYPSDNLASWIVLMRLARHIYHCEEVKHRLWRAITEQSLIYRLVRKSGATAYSAGLSLLERAFEE